MSPHWTIRRECNKDFNLIDSVILAASDGGQESVDIVRNLRADGHALLSLVAEIDSRVVGHIMMSRMVVETTARIPAVALAPLMVEPAFQRIGLGSALSTQALDHCRATGESMVFVLGHPTYYPRFGFSAELVRDLAIPFRLKVPGAYMALELKPDALKGIAGRVRYAPAFGLPPEWTL